MPIQTELAHEFPKEFIKKTPSGQHGKADYVPWTTIVQVIIDKTGPFDWRNVQIVYSPGGTQITVSGELTTYRENGRAVTTAGVNASETSGNKTLSPAAAESDALKRAAAKQGIGLHLWTGDDPYFLHGSLVKKDAEAEKSLPSRPVPIGPDPTVTTP